MKKKLFNPLLLVCFGLLSNASFSQKIQFDYTGEMQTYIVPPGVSTVTIDLYGASGGWNDYSGVMYDKYVPGKGGRLTATYPVYSGQKLYIFVGGKGADAQSGIGGAGGFNGGGNGNTSSTYSGGGGGGASDIRVDGITLENRVLVVGGGGGAAYNYPDGGDHGGQGGDLIGGDGESNFLKEDNSRGRGGSQSKGGLGGQWTSYDKAEDGSFGKGGDGPAGTSGTGGGGGYYGGGGGCWSGGGGGSSFTNFKAQQIKHEQGVNEGHGKVIISTGFSEFSETITCKNPIVQINGPTTICEGESISFNAVSNFGGELVWDNGIQNNIVFTPSIGKTTYTVTSSNKKECSYSVDITVVSRNIKATTTNGIICEGETTTLIGHGAQEYLWSNGIQNNVPFTPPVGVNNYTVRSASLEKNTCHSESSVFVVVNKVEVTADVQQNTATKNAAINLTPTGGTYPYSFVWKKDGVDFSKLEDLANLAPATYEVIIVDAIGCSTTQKYLIEGEKKYNPQSKSLYAEMSSDQLYLNITYSGKFDYKIQNDRGEIILTGTINNATKVDISRLPAGNYHVCSLYNTTTERVNFVKW